MNVLFLITLQRSGSTVLFDALRYSGVFKVNASWKYFEEIGAGRKRRRYPRDVSVNQGPNSHRIEVEKGLWEYMEPIDGLCEFGSGEPERGCDVEKLHPHFIGYSSGRLKKVVRQQGGGVGLVVRRPSQAIDSFLRYQSRDPGWYSGRGVINVIWHYYRELRFLKGLSNDDGISTIWIEYKDFMFNYDKVFDRIAEFSGVSLNKHARSMYLDAVSSCLFSGERKRVAFQGALEQKSVLGQLPSYQRRLIKWLDEYYDIVVNRTEG